MALKALRYLLKPARDHLAGRHHWGLTLVFSVIAMTYLYRLVIAQLPVLPALPAIVAALLLGIALLIWQVRGILQAIKYNLSPPSDPSAAGGGYFTIIVAVILLGLAMVDGTVRLLPKPEPAAALSGPTFSVTYDSATASASLTGDINYASKAALDGVLHAHPEAQTVILDSEGGLIFAARPMARAIHRRGLNTHVSRQCFSACTLVFMAGRHRTIAKTGTLGFHRYGYTNRFLIQTIDPEIEQQRDLDYFRARGVNSDFLARIYKTAHDDIWRPGHATLRAASVITEPPVSN